MFSDIFDNSLIYPYQILILSDFHFISYTEAVNWKTLVRYQIKHNFYKHIHLYIQLYMYYRYLPAVEIARAKPPQ